MARPTIKKKHLIEKYYELVWALAEQDYNGQDLGIIFNRHRSVIMRVLLKKPKDWKTKWQKTT